MIKKLILAGIALAVAAAAVALHESRAGTGAARAAATPADAASSFAILRRPALAADAATAAVGVVTRDHADLDAAGSRRAGLSQRRPDVRVVPGVDRVCLVVDADPGAGFAGMGCAAWTDALAGALDVTLTGPPQHQATALIAGLVPDGTSAVLRSPEGGTAPLAVTDNVYWADAPIGSAVVTSGPAGQREHPVLGPGGSG